MAVKLFVAAFCNAFLAALLYHAERKTFFRNVSYQMKQIVCGVLFGMTAMFSSTTLGGVDIGGAVINVRDASPLCAGLIFGAPAGILAGLIGGIFRYVATYWGLVGAYTQTACAISTILVGFIAAVLRKCMFEDKKPTWIYGVGIAMVCEILHMLMIFFTNMNDVSTAFGFVKSGSIPMVIGNSIAVGTAIGVVSLISRETQTKKWKKSQKQISQTFQFWLFVCIIIAFGATSIFTSILQTKMSERETETVIQTNINDVYQDIMDASDENLLNKMREIRKNYLAGVDVDTLAEQYNVIEVNIIDADGFIRFTNYAAYQDYDMASGEQSAEFLVLLDGEKESYIQDYRPTSYDNETYRKYGGLTLPDGGFLQVGYDATQFGDDIDAFVGKVTKNRHIGKQGFIIICDEQFRIVTEDSQELGKELKSVGISVDLEKMPSDEIFEVDLNSVPHLCTYRFVEGYYIIGMMPVEEAMFMKTLSVYVNVFMQIIIFAALFVLIYFLIKKIIIDNLRKINGTLAQITNGNLDVTVEVRSNEEFASLSDDINSTVTTLKQYIAEAAARIDQELEFAKQIQYSSLPVTFPDRCEIELYAKMRTAKEVGGDFYDFYMLNDHVVAFMIADVSGKGIPAAMFMMKAKTIIKDLAESGLEPDEIFTRANEKLCENNDASMFVTAWLGILDLATGLLKFANAGHNPPLLCKRGEDFAYLKNRSGLFLAGMEGIRYRKNELQMEPGDRIYLYTDGVTEATNKSNKLYGEEKLLELTNDLRAVAPKEFCKMIEEDVDRFVEDAPQFDDITMLCLSLNCLMAENEIVVLCKEGSLEAVKRFEEKLVSKLMAALKVANRIHIIFDEIYANILHYSNAKTITIRYQIKDEKLQLTFLDDGIPYDPLNTVEPDITLSAEEREIGGLGILIVKNMSESMEYVYKDNKNILNLTISLF